MAHQGARPLDAQGYPVSTGLHGPRPLGAASSYDPSRAAQAHYAATGEHVSANDFQNGAPLGDYNYSTGYMGNASRQNLMSPGYAQQGWNDAANPYATDGFESNHGHRSVPPAVAPQAHTGRAPSSAAAAGASAGLGAAGASAAHAGGVPPNNTGAAKYNAATSGSRKRRGMFGGKKWLWWLLGIIAVIVILAIALGVGLGVGLTQDDKKGGNDNDKGSAVSGIGTGKPQSNLAAVFPQDVRNAASNAAKSGGGDQLSYTGTDVYGNPMFTSAANTGAPSTGKQPGSCGKDPWKATNNLNNGRPGHPRLIAPQYMWDCLPSKIQNDAYLTAWNHTIMTNASTWLGAKPVTYDVDGGLTLSGILDVSRIVQQRLKAWAYAYRMTRDKKYSDRAYQEMSVAAGNTSQPFGDGVKRWNPDHFLDTAEMIAAYSFAYDWMFDAWNDQQKSYIRDWIVTYGLQQGMDMYNSGTAWWSQPASGNGNWNCVSNGGLVFGALAVQNDVTGAAKNTTDTILQTALNNAKNNCMRGVYEDGTWSETPNYWYFGTNGHARMLSALITATGSDQGLMSQNKNWYKTSEFHMYVTGNGGMYAYGDNGPNKFSTTANQLFLYSQLAKNPLYALFQRDRADAASDPLSMFWYDASSKGGFFNGLPLDRFFDNDQNSWGTMRSSWTDTTGVYVAMKSSNMTGHQTHGDLDAGDFVIDALGTRFVGEYGSDNYLAKDYFASEEDSAARWTYFRKGTQGQNTVVIGKQNQHSSCKPKNTFQSSNTAQNGDLSFTPDQSSTAFMVTDMSQCYGQQDGSVKRGIRMLNGRRQVLVQDEIKSPNQEIQWRVQTNATVTLSGDKKTATLKINKVENPNAPKDPLMATLENEVTMVATIVQPQDAQFEVNPAYNKQTNAPNYYYGADKVPQQDKDINGNPIQAEVLDFEVSVLSITLPGNADTNIQVWWQPQYGNGNDADKNTPKNVPLAQWSLTSH